MAPILVGLMLAGCSETGIGVAGNADAKANPPDLGPTTRLDRIVQTTVPEVDVLWVIDNSCSMSEEQAKLTTNFPLFMNYFVDSGLDWHVGVVSTDMADANHKGKLRQAGGYRFLDETAPNVVQLFKQMAQMGTSGSYDEKGRAATYTALEILRDTYNDGFLREDASLSVIVISDENDYSGNSPVSLPEFISWLGNLKADDDMVTFSSIVGPSAPCYGSEEPGADYMAVTNAIGGITWSICEQDWSQVLEELGMQAAGLKREFFLSEVPRPETIEVWVVEDGEDGHTYQFRQGDDYEYSQTRNSIRFLSYVPDPLSEVFIEYEVLASFQSNDDGETQDTGQ